MDGAGVASRPDSHRVLQGIDIFQLYSRPGQPQPSSIFAAARAASCPIARLREGRREGPIRDPRYLVRSRQPFPQAGSPSRRQPFPGYLLAALPAIQDISTYPGAREGGGGGGDGWKGVEGNARGSRENMRSPPRYAFPSISRPV